MSERSRYRVNVAVEVVIQGSPMNRTTRLELESTERWSYRHIIQTLISQNVVQQGLWYHQYYKLSDIHVRWAQPHHFRLLFQSFIFQKGIESTSICYYWIWRKPYMASPIATSDFNWCCLECQVQCTHFSSLISQKEELGACINYWTRIRSHIRSKTTQWDLN